MSNSRQHLCVSLRWLAGRTSIKSINYPSSIPAREARGILLPSAVHPSAVPLVPCTKETEQPMGRICKGQEIHGFQEATSKYWSYQQAIAWFCISSLVHVHKNKTSLQKALKQILANTMQGIIICDLCMQHRKCLKI